MSERSVIRRFILEETNIIVTTLTACALLYTRSVGVAYFAVGAVSCSLSVKVVKRIIKQPRPVHPNSRKKTYGMPSTHSATITHFAVYIPLACRYLPLHPTLPTTPWFRTLTPLVVVPWAAAIIQSRIWLGHHTWQQCAVGAMYGAAFSLCWFALWTVGGLSETGQPIEDFVHQIIF